QLLALLDRRDEVGEVTVGHRVAPGKIRRGGLFLLGLHFAGLLAPPVIGLVAIAIDDDRAFGAENERAALAIVGAHALATIALPGEHLAGVIEVRDERVVELPVVVILIAAALRAHGFRVIDAERPAAHVHFVRAVVERLTSAPHL